METNTKEQAIPFEQFQAMEVEWMAENERLKQELADIVNRLHGELEQIGAERDDWHARYEAVSQTLAEERAEHAQAIADLDLAYQQQLAQLGPGQAQGGGIVP